MIFKKILRTQAASQWARTGQTGVPVYIAAVIIPFITGIRTGISVAFVGIAPAGYSLYSKSHRQYSHHRISMPYNFKRIYGVMLSLIICAHSSPNPYFKRADHSYLYRTLYAPSSISIFDPFISHTCHVGQQLFMRLFMCTSGS